MWTHMWTEQDDSNRHTKGQGDRLGGLNPIERMTAMDMSNGMGGKSRVLRPIERTTDI